MPLDKTKQKETAPSNAANGRAWDLGIGHFRCLGGPNFYESYETPGPNGNTKAQVFFHKIACFFFYLFLLDV